MSPRTIAVVAVVAALLLAGCGGSTANGTTPGDPTATDTPTVNPDPAYTSTPTDAPTDTPTDAPTDTTTDEPTDTTTGTPQDPLLSAVETYVSDQYSNDASAVEGGIVFPNDSTDRTFYATPVASKNEPERFDASVLEEPAEALVANTSFENSYLVVIQAFPASSAPDYRVEGIDRTGNGLHLRINDSSRYGTDDVTVETLLVRVPKDGAVPDLVSVTTEDGVEFDSSMGVVNVDELQEERRDEDDQ